MKYLYLYRIRAEILIRRVGRFLASYIINTLFSVDCLANAVLGGNPRETISARLGHILNRNPDHLVARPICRVLGLFEKNHCRASANVLGCKKEEPQ